jgi:RNA polymerase sigma-70 factor (ECF subfamily)
MGDRDFDEFYAANYGRFVVQLYAVTGSLPDAEDAVQEAFARASVHWDALARQLVDGGEEVGSARR